MGSAEEAKGKLKEAAGSVTGSDDLRKEGHAQQRKGQQEQKAAEARATADEHERQAESAEHAERNHQGT
ncbi:MAG: CsbD family protein [Pseudonocardiales bacterium]|nr:CsbD family protein [Pseudonocardiales bacterium]